MKRIYIEETNVAKLRKAWFAVKKKTQFSAELGCAALAGRVATTKEDDEVDPIYTCNEIYNLKAALRPFLHVGRWECSAPRWLSRRCREHLKQIDKMPARHMRNWDVVQHWFRVVGLGSIWDHPGRIGENLVLQPYSFGEFDQVSKTLECLAVAVVSRPGERGFHHPETFLYELEESWPQPKTGIGWTADEGWVNAPHDEDAKM
jgi:hypothetical protein